MKCFYHPNEDAVAQCQKCGRGLCHPCATNNNRLVCRNCSDEKVEKEKMSSVLTLIISIIVFSLMYNFIDGVAKTGESYSENSGATMAFKLVFSYIYMAGVWGWRRLNAIKLRGIFILPLFGWLIYFAIKFSIGAMIGIFIAPYDIFITIKELLFRKNKVSE